MATIGLLHPGEMGAAVGGCLAAAGHTVLWDPEGRSRATTGRALGAGLDGAGLAAVLGRSTVIFSICPPHAALDVAHQVAEGGFGGIYVDANAVSVATARRVAAVVEAAGASYVDGGIIGPPPENAGHTRLYLSGKRAPEVQVLLRRSALEARIADGPQFAASSVKMAYAAWTKGTSALLLAVRALARAEGVERTLLAEWALSQQSLPAQSEGAALAAALKGWRWIGEMDEIAASMATAGLPTGFHEAAADVYDRAARSTATGPADSEGDSSRRIGGRPATARSARGGEPGAAALDAVLSSLL
jgi:3-hydroxyisobutyrate dehydrogenase-like beta-hydroxyacid dehydrogenase